jgi:hypothetical protein
LQGSKLLCEFDDFVKVCNVEVVDCLALEMVRGCTSIDRFEAELQGERSCVLGMTLAPLSK